MKTVGKVIFGLGVVAGIIAGAIAVTRNAVSAAPAPTGGSKPKFSPGDWIAPAMGVIDVIYFVEGTNMGVYVLQTYDIAGQPASSVLIDIAKADSQYVTILSPEKRREWNIYVDPAKVRSSQLVVMLSELKNIGIGVFSQSADPSRVWFDHATGTVKEIAQALNVDGVLGVDY